MYEAFYILEPPSTSTAQTSCRWGYCESFSWPAEGPDSETGDFQKLVHSTHLPANPKSPGRSKKYWADPTKTEDHFLQHKKFDVNTLAPKQWVSSVSTLSALRPLPYVQKESEQKQQEGLSTFMVHQVCGPGYSTLLIHHIINNPDKINPLCHGYTWIIKVPPIISLSAPRLAKSKRPSEDSGLRKKRGWSASHACQKHIVPEWCKRLL